MPTVDGLYERILADETLAPYFAGLGIEQLKAHQRAFIAAALGGPALPRALDDRHRAHAARSDGSSAPRRHPRRLDVDSAIIAEIGAALARSRTGHGTPDARADRSFIRRKHSPLIVTSGMTETQAATTPVPWDELRRRARRAAPAAADVMAAHRPHRRRRAAGPPERGGGRHPDDGHHVHRLLRGVEHRPGLAVRRHPPDHRGRRVARRRARAGAAAAGAQHVHRRRLQRPPRASPTASSRPTSWTTR